MKNKFNLFSALLLAMALSTCNPEGGINNAGDLTTPLDSMSYAVGTYISKQFKEQGISLNGSKMQLGVSEAIGGKAYLNETQCQEVIMRYQMGMAQRQGTPFTDADKLPVDLDSLSYAIGVDFGNQMKQIGVSVNDAAFGRGCQDTNKEEGSLFNDEMITKQLQNFSTSIREKTMAANSEAAKVNIEKGKAFLAEKAAEADVKSTDSGLLYKVLKEGSGKSPVATDRVAVHYEGRLIDGTVFDSSYERGEPAEFALNEVIPGWTEGVQLMKPNAKYQFYIPSNLAYGDTNAPPSIGPGQTLVFDVELLEIK